MVAWKNVWAIMNGMDKEAPEEGGRSLGEQEAEKEEGFSDQL